MIKHGRRIKGTQLILDRTALKAIALYNDHGIALIALDRTHAQPA